MNDFKSTMYVIVDKKGNALPQYISYFKKTCIEIFVSCCGTDWQEMKKYGWKCVKVIVTIKETNFNLD